MNLKDTDQYGQRVSKALAWHQQCIDASIERVSLQETVGNSAEYLLQMWEGRLHLLQDQLINSLLTSSIEMQPILLEYLPVVISEQL